MTVISTYLCSWCSNFFFKTRFGSAIKSRLHVCQNSNQTIRKLTPPSSIWHRRFPLTVPHLNLWGAAITNCGSHRKLRFSADVFQISVFSMGRNAVLQKKKGSNPDFLLTWRLNIETSLDWSRHQRIEVLSSQSLVSEDPWVMLDYGCVLNQRSWHKFQVSKDHFVLINHPVAPTNWSLSVAPDALGSGHGRCSRMLAWCGLCQQWPWLSTHRSPREDFPGINHPPSGMKSCKSWLSSNH